jgi:hypothetical protein
MQTKQLSDGAALLIVSTQVCLESGHLLPPDIDFGSDIKELQPAKAVNKSQETSTGAPAHTLNAPFTIIDIKLEDAIVGTQSEATSSAQQANMG